VCSVGFVRRSLLAQMEVGQKERDMTPTILCQGTIGTSNLANRVHV
jgi:hypothetical protein